MSKTAKPYKWTEMMHSPVTARERIEDVYLGGTKMDTVLEVALRIEKMIDLILQGYILTEPGKLEFPLAVPIWAQSPETLNQIQKTLIKNDFVPAQITTKRICSNIIFVTCTYESKAMVL